MNPCHACGARTHIILITTNGLLAICRSCLEQEKRRMMHRRKRMFGEPTDGTLFTGEG
jgi:hypothetical protein